MGLPRHTPIQPTQADLEELMQVAQIAANAAAEVTMRYFRQALSVENKAGEGLEKSVQRLVSSERSTMCSKAKAV